jgi:hypothetical protein
MALHSMKNWTTKEAKSVLDWARRPVEERRPLEEFASELGRSSDGVRRFLHRVLPPGQRPWHEKPRWTSSELDALRQQRLEIVRRSAAAVRKYRERHSGLSTDRQSDDEAESIPLTVAQAASDLGLSRAAVYRLIKAGILRRFKGRIAETSFGELLRDHPEMIPYSKLRREQKEWLVLNGYRDASLAVKRPSVRGLLD